MDFLSRMFTSLFRSSANRFQDRAMAQLRRNTIGRVQGKAMSAMANMDKKLYNASDNLTGMDKKKNPGGAAQRGMSMPGGNAGGGGAGMGPGRQAGGSGGQAGGKQEGQIAVRQQGSAKMGKGKRNKDQQAIAITCMTCKSSLQSDWDMCPYCGTPVGQVGSRAPQPMAPGAPQPVDNGEKTVALNLEQLNMSQQKTVVGWIVAQNGNHRGEDFRIYDGKNILGTAADCDIVITDPFLSAKHCTIRHENGNFQVTDLDSMNGTFVNQKRCTKSDLIDNDTIRLGRTEFKFKSLF